ncbi:MAG TPA: MarR family winged helix-turn-helix transcriptional regulator [Cellulomonas sp.]
MTDDERGDAQVQILRALERMGRLMREMSQVIARDHARTRATNAIARILDTAGEVGVGDVAEALRIDMSVASRQVSELVAEGLVERTVAHGDRRARNLRLTASGRAYADELRAVMRRMADETFADWTVDDLHAAAGTLDRLVESVTASAACPPESVPADTANTADPADSADTAAHRGEPAPSRTRRPTAVAPG